MPLGQPFTHLCQLLMRPPAAGRADLHLHSTVSDGRYTPAQVVDLARRAGLGAIALTDHDTLAGVASARVAAGTALEVISGVEITCDFRGQELHLLGYFVRLDAPDLLAALERLRRHRVERYREMIERLRDCGVTLEEEPLPADKGATLGRRHLAEALLRQGKVGSVREAFTRYLRDDGRATVPKLRLPVA